jgi:alpha-methylacyl-CoA racemase
MLTKRGPLAGLRVVELASLGPAPHASMILADQGADVVRIGRPHVSGPQVRGVDLAALTSRNKRLVVLDLKLPAALDDALRLIDLCDVLVEGLRPGVAERLGVGPQVCCGRNTRLVFARITGWGQTGPLAARAGHDINYIGISGTLDAIGRAGDRPFPPLNLVGDFGGGSMLLVAGILMALWERERTGTGQVVDAAMVEGTALLSQMLWEMKGHGAWPGRRGTNLLDGGAPFYDTYVCADGRHVAVGALEPQFFHELVLGLGLDPDVLPAQMDEQRWPELRDIFARSFQRRSRDEWMAVFETTDACVTPVLTAAEAPAHPHNLLRETFSIVHGVTQPSPAPRFSRTPAAAPAPPQSAEVDEILTDWNLPCL